MLLNSKDQKNIRCTKFHKHYALNEQGEVRESDSDEFDFQIEKLRNHMIGLLSEKGFQVKRVKPSRANCIIRVYKGRYNSPDYSIEESLYCLFGADCFTKDSITRRWRTANASIRDIEIDYSKWEYRFWLFQDDYIMIKTEFFDTYVNISKKG